MTNRCCMCKENEENIIHLFLECQFAQRVWAMVWDKLGLYWVLLDNLGQFIKNWDFPFNHPKLVMLWQIIAPHVCWHIWKEMNNRLFRNEEKLEEVIMRIMQKLIMENILNTKCRLPKEELGWAACKIAERWGIQKNFKDFDNSKIIKRQQTKWKPATSTWLKLNFDGAAREGIEATGGVLRDANGEALIVYVGRVGEGSNNKAKVTALLWGLQLITKLQIREITIEGDSKLIIDMENGASQPGWGIQNIIRDVRHFLGGLEVVHL